MMLGASAVPMDSPQVKEVVSANLDKDIHSSAHPDDTDHESKILNVEDIKYSAVLKLHSRGVFKFTTRGRPSKDLLLQAFEEIFEPFIPLRRVDVDILNYRTKCNELQKHADIKFSTPQTYSFNLNNITKDSVHKQLSSEAKTCFDNNREVSENESDKGQTESCLKETNISISLKQDQRHIQYENKLEELSDTNYVQSPKMSKHTEKSVKSKLQSTCVKQRPEIVRSLLSESVSSSRAGPNASTTPIYPFLASRHLGDAKLVLERTKKILSESQTKRSQNVLKGHKMSKCSYNLQRYKQQLLLGNKKIRGSKSIKSPFTVSKVGRASNPSPDSSKKQHITLKINLENKDIHCFNLDFKPCKNVSEESKHGNTPAESTYVETPTQSTETNTEILKSQKMNLEISRSSRDTVSDSMGLIQTIPESGNLFATNDEPLVDHQEEAAIIDDNFAQDSPSHNQLCDQSTPSRCSYQQSEETEDSNKSIQEISEDNSKNFTVTQLSAAVQLTDTLSQDTLHNMPHIKPEKTPGNKQKRGQPSKQVYNRCTSRKRRHWSKKSANEKRLDGLIKSLKSQLYGAARKRQQRRQRAAAKLATAKQTRKKSTRKYKVKSPEPPKKSRKRHRPEHTKDMIISQKHQDVQDDELPDLLPLKRKRSTTTTGGKNGVAECQSLRLAMDLPRHNWLEHKILYRSQSQDSSVPNVVGDKAPVGNCHRSSSHGATQTTDHQLNAEQSPKDLPDKEGFLSTESPKRRRNDDDQQMKDLTEEKENNTVKLPDVDTRILPPIVQPLSPPHKQFAKTKPFTIKATTERKDDGSESSSSITSETFIPGIEADLSEERMILNAEYSPVETCSRSEMLQISNPLINKAEDIDALVIDLPEGQVNNDDCCGEENSNSESQSMIYKTNCQDALHNDPSISLESNSVSQVTEVHSSSCDTVPKSNDTSLGQTLTVVKSVASPVISSTQAASSGITNEDVAVKENDHKVARLVPIMNIIPEFEEDAQEEEIDTDTEPSTLASFKNQYEQKMIEYRTLQAMTKLKEKEKQLLQDRLKKVHKEILSSRTLYNEIQNTSKKKTSSHSFIDLTKDDTQVLSLKSEASNSTESSTDSYALDLSIKGETENSTSSQPRPAHIRESTVNVLVRHSPPPAHSSKIDYNSFTYMHCKVSTNDMSAFSNNSEDKTLRPLSNPSECSVTVEPIVSKVSTPPYSGSAANHRSRSLDDSILSGKELTSPCTPPDLIVKGNVRYHLLNPNRETVIKSKETLPDSKSECIPPLFLKSNVDREQLPSMTSVASLSDAKIYSTPVTSTLHHSNNILPINMNSKSTPCARPHIKLPTSFRGAVRRPGRPRLSQRISSSLYPRYIRLPQQPSPPRFTHNFNNKQQFNNIQQERPPPPPYSIHQMLNTIDPPSNPSHQPAGTMDVNVMPPHPPDLSPTFFTNNSVHRQQPGLLVNDHQSKSIRNSHPLVSMSNMVEGQGDRYEEQANSHLISSLQQSGPNGMMMNSSSVPDMAIPMYASTNNLQPPKDFVFQSVAPIDLQHYPVVQQELSDSQISSQLQQPIRERQLQQYQGYHQMPQPSITQGEHQALPQLQKIGHNQIDQNVVVEDNMRVQGSLIPDKNYVTLQHRLGPQPQMMIPQVSGHLNSNIRHMNQTNVTSTTSNMRPMVSSHEWQRSQKHPPHQHQQHQFHQWQQEQQQQLQKQPLQQPLHMRNSRIETSTTNGRHVPFDASQSIPKVTLHQAAQVPPTSHMPNMVGLSLPSRVAVVIERKPDGNEHKKGERVVCAVCSKPAAFLCSGCATTPYCSSQCQHRVWNLHKNECRRQNVVTIKQPVQLK